MTEHAIAVRLAGARIAVETVVDDPDFKGVANTSYLDPEAAIRLGEGLIRLGRVAKGEAASPTVRPRLSAYGPGSVTDAASYGQTKVLLLAVPYDPHAGDR